MPKKNDWSLLREHLCVTLVIVVSFVSVVSPVSAISDVDIQNSDCNGTECRNLTADSMCTNEDGWNLRGSDWGCCGNYEGCCTYASFICYLHDAMCKCCDIAAKLCGPKCKPEPYCFPANAQKYVPHNKDNQYLNDQPQPSFLENEDETIDVTTTESTKTFDSNRKVKTDIVQYRSSKTEESSASSGHQNDQMTYSGLHEDNIEGSGETEEKVIL